MQLGYFRTGSGANIDKAAVTFLYAVGWVLILDNAAVTILYGVVWTFLGQLREHKRNTGGPILTCDDALMCVAISESTLKEIDPKEASQPNFCKATVIFCPDVT